MPVLNVNYSLDIYSLFRSLINDELLTVTIQILSVVTTRAICCFHHLCGHLSSWRQQMLRQMLVRRQKILLQMFVH